MNQEYMKCEYMNWIIIIIINAIISLTKLHVCLRSKAALFIYIYILTRKRRKGDTEEDTGK